MNSKFAIMWDCYGLEAVEKCPDGQDVTYAILAEKPMPKFPAIMHWRLRAQFNPQRNYEIWIIDAVEGITVEDIQEMFTASPQVSADTIRRIGHCFYSNRATEEKVVIR